MTTPTRAQPGRNQPCHCGSGRKYKHCCLEKDDRRGGRRSGQGRSGSGSGGCIVGGGHVGSHTSAKAPNASTLEGDHFSWFRPAHADATQGRWQLSEAMRPTDPAC